MNLFSKQKETHRHRKQTYGYQREKGEGGGINYEAGINIYTQLCIKQATNNDLLYSTGNYTQYYVTIYKGKNIYTHINICAAELLCCTPKTDASLVAQTVKPTCNAGDLGSIPGLEDTQKKGMASHSTICAWKIPWTEESDGRQTVHGVTKSQT